jgi:hypothetical protein
MVRASHLGSRDKKNGNFEENVRVGYMLFLSL